VAAAGAAVLLVVTGAVVGCSSDDSEGADAPRRTTTTSADRPDRTSTTEAPATTTTTAPATTAPPTSAGGGGSSAFRGTVDGQDGIEVTFVRGATALTDVRADGLELTCQPLEGGDSTTITVDVAMPEVPLGASELVEHTQSDAPYEPTLAGSFTPAGSFAGALSLSGQRDGFACGGEFTFIATPT
jgi:hypothetical protein